MNRTVAVTLWLIVLVLGAGLLASAVVWQGSRQSAAEVGSTGKVLVEVPWKHLPQVDPFVLTERSGKPFDSSALAGRPYVISFFFASCPTICQDLNDTVRRLNEQHGDEELTFLSITCDPQTDTPDVLTRYATAVDADGYRWYFLTGEMYLIKQIGEQNFRASVDKDFHTEDIMLVDRWGRYRDRFKWDDPTEISRFGQVLKQVLAETEPPIERTVVTRNALAGLPHQQAGQIPWLREFHLVDSHAKPFFSRDLTGEVWIASFFFTSCPQVCKQQNEYLRALQDRLPEGVRLISITTDSQVDTPDRLRQYAADLGADPARWTFLTGDAGYIRRVAAEFFGTSLSGDHHSTELFVVDRWGTVRGQANWQDGGAEASLISLVRRLGGEPYPPRPAAPAQ